MDSEFVQEFRTFYRDLNVINFKINNDIDLNDNDKNIMQCLEDIIPEYNKKLKRLNELDEIINNHKIEDSEFENESDASDSENDSEDSYLEELNEKIIEMTQTNLDRLNSIKQKKWICAQEIEQDDIPVVTQ